MLNYPVVMDELIKGDRIGGSLVVFVISRIKGW